MNEQLPVQLSFDVSLPERAQRIRDLVGVARTCIIEIGRELIAAKAEIAHGDWLPWLKEEFGWDERTAQRYTAVARAFGKYDTLSDFTGLTIDATALYALSAPDVPTEARAEAVERAEEGEHVSLADAEDMIAKALAVEREKFEAAVEEVRAAYEAEKAETASEENPDGSDDIAKIVERICQATGQKKLKPAQFQQLACILGTAITDGRKVYPPATLEESQQAEQRLRVAAPAVRALEYFLVAPGPTVVFEALHPSQVDIARRSLEHAGLWLGALGQLLGRK